MSATGCEGDARVGSQRPRVILFPGLGADARMFDGLRRSMPWVEAPGWIEHEAGESLRRYAARLAESLDVREPAVLGGVSMGGMVALEAARVVPTLRVLLIASCRGAESVSRLLRLSELVLRPAPSMLVDRGRILAPIFVGTGGVPKGDRRLLARMAKELPVEFLRWAARAVVEWEGCADPGVPVRHIHGGRDWAIPLRKVRPDVVIPAGAHVLHMSHPAEVRRFIEENVGEAVEAARAQKRGVGN